MCTMHCRIYIQDWIVNDVTWCGYMLPIHLYSYCTVEMKKSACAVPCGQWITAAHKQRRKFPSWKEAICPCWSATGSLHFCKAFREIWQWNRLGAFCNLQFCDQQTCSQDRKPCIVFYWTTRLSSPLPDGQLSISRAKTPHPRRMKNTSTVNFLAPTHSYTAKEHYK